MKKQLLFILIFFSSVFAQYNIHYAVNPNIYQLNGFEDTNGSTNLFFRINSKYYDNIWEYNDNSIYHLNISAGTDSLFLNDYSQSNPIYAGEGQSITNYDFWINNPRKFLYAYGTGGIDYDFTINSYFAEQMYNGAIFDISYVSAYKNSDTIFSFVYKSMNNESLLIKYKGHNGGEFFYDTLGVFNAVSHSPYNNNIYFGEEDKGILYKTIDEGHTKYLADTTPGYSWYYGHVLKTIFYDSDQNHIYRLTGGYQNYKLMVSDNEGEPGSWIMKYSSPDKIFFCNDNSVAGLSYISNGRSLYKSTNYFNSFSHYKSFSGVITGLYKKPGVDKLYLSTAYHIYEITPDSVIIIKTLFEKDQLAYDPIAVGNKWVYKGYNMFTDTLVSNYIKVKEVLKDTIINNKQYKKIVTRTAWENNYQYERIDAATGLVYFIDQNGSEYIADDLNILVGDTLSYSRYFLSDPYTILQNEDSLKVFSTDSYGRNYITSGLGFSYDKYTLAVNFGLIYHRQDIEDAANIDSIKGCVINGVVYGDTNSVLAVENEENNLLYRYNLAQNYPNPFNPSTTIEYSVPQSGKVRLKIYDLLGREVRQLVNEVKNAGKYKVEFNASSLSSGVYFYKLESGSFTETKKLMLLK